MNMYETTTTGGLSIKIGYHNRIYKARVEINGRFSRDFSMSMRKPSEHENAVYVLSGSLDGQTYDVLFTRSMLDAMRITLQAVNDAVSGCDNSQNGFFKKR